MDDLRVANNDTPLLWMICTDPAWSHLVDEVLATNPNLEYRYRDFSPLGLAMYSGILTVARALVAAGADPTGLGKKGRNVIHNALFYNGGGEHDVIDVVGYAIEICPGGVNVLDNNGRSPLQIALDQCVSKDVVGLLLRHGCSTRKLTFGMIQRTRIMRLLIAYGYRYSVEEEREWISKRECGTGFNQLAAMFGTEQCRSVARVFLGLGRIKGRLLVYGRDVLRLVAKEVWLSRMDEGWLDR